ncbi:phenylalanine--tRNA ligase subunit alpha [Lactobacillus sp. YT155]|uniref:phenylalanine--tRNA ligase subunit alpha n=1 Tax=Lactobacillus sp. YT155 TaxID=3060955 RepID=UPI00265D82B5|nr:phenylalanine--tRNA ligase subunit alpha [Lactobacillus sp. YT155]MDO1605584.1 phenylalanine--tRNA ligase subunit alpha [Lactobacillus sp. YT155]
MSLKDDLEKLKEEGLKNIAESDEPSELNDIRVRLLGKKSPITDALRQMKDLPAEERPKVGSFANQIKEEIANAIAEQQAEFEKMMIEAKLKSETIDVTLPSHKTKKTGTMHVLHQIIADIEELFIGLGYQVINGSEVEEDKYNFEKMNIPKDHPARDMQDTFYIDDELLLRTHTSPQQARTMEEHDFSKGPLKMISPGKVYRRDTDDATHSHQFHQIEGLVVDKNITMSDLKGTLEILVRHVFGAERKIRFRPSYFPFTEPSVEVDITCFACGGTGCKICKGTGWIEVLGAGLVHPNVLKNSGVNPEVYSGFAFGIGPDRLAMLKYGVEDIRNFYLNDVRFIEQFKGEEA